MPYVPPRSRDAGGGSRLSNWFWILVIVLICGVSWWQNRQPVLEQPVGQNPDSRTVGTTSSSGSSESLPNPDEPQHAPVSTEREHSDKPDSAPVPPGRSTHESNSHRKAESQGEHSVRVDNQTIRDLNGNVAYKGTIDLTPTLDRIERGGANRHRNDGTTFQNREGRLPRKPAGYYKEYVHPTPGENGPGPQRVIVGQEGEIWYTPDHYKSFREIQAAKHAPRHERGPNPKDP